MTVFSSKHLTQTKTICPVCGSFLIAKRSCSHILLYCDVCHHQFSLQECIPIMDEVLENFIQEVNIDRL